MEPARHVEQFEIVERHITEGRRPLSRNEALSFVPSSAVHQSGETFLASGVEAERIYRTELDRARAVQERDVDRSASIVQDDQILSPSGINNYGYDEQLVRTSDGTARVIQTHGGGQYSPKRQASSTLMQDRSLETSLRPVDNLDNSHFSTAVFKTPARTTPQSILKNSDSRHFSSFEDSSLVRKDSYKRMQESQGDNLSYSPSSNATMISKETPKGAKWTFSQRASQAGGGLCLSLRNAWEQFVQDLRSRELTPSLICGLLLILLFILFLVILLVLFLRSAFFPYSVHSFLLFPPKCEECIKRNPTLSAYQPPSKVFVHTKSPSQIDFELVGNRPFKSNSLTAIDFDSGYVAYADHALTNDHGRHTTCFLMELDKAAMPSHSELMYALSNTDYEVHSEFGWQEYWQWAVSPIDATTAMSHFHNAVEDCAGAQWYQLKHTVHTRDSSCYDCYDFCLPDYAIQRTHKYEDDITVGIRRLNCFRFYVPEWSRYSVRSDEEGGHWNYPRKQIYTQRDQHGDWTNWTPVAVVGQPGLRRRRR